MVALSAQRQPLTDLKVKFLNAQSSPNRDPIKIGMMKYTPMMSVIKTRIRKV